MRVQYDKKHDLLYIRLDERGQEVVCRDVAEGVTLDLGEGDRIVGIEILDASHRLDLDGVRSLTVEDAA